jgi:hypothetical protein
MNNIYRCQTLKNRKSLSFSKTASKSSKIQNILNQVTEAENAVNAIFSRPVPVVKHTSRFVPLGYTKLCIYYSQKEECTFYEYLFHIIENSSNKGKSISLNIIYSDLDQTGCILKHISRLKNKTQRNNILSPNTYLHSHNYMNSLAQSPDIIVYPSTRYPSPAKNYAIFKRDAIKNVTTSIDKYIAKLTKETSNHLEVTISKNGTSNFKILLDKKSRTNIS